jgi:tetratricopeptide (TPR) repeat protein
MTDIKEIAEDIYSKENTKSHRDLIDNFERHQKTIETIDFKATVDTYDIYSQLLADYGIALAETQSYNKAIPAIDKALELLENNKKFTTKTLPNVKFYETLIFNRGICNYYLDKFEMARPDFELLVRLYPNNDNYPKWTNAIKNKKLNRLKNILWYFVAGSVLIESFYNKTTLIKDLTFGIGLLALLGAIILETMMYIRKRKYGA